MMKKLILNCFHLHGLSNKFPFLFLSFAMFHDPGLLFWWEPMLGRNLSNYVTDVTYIVYHFQVKWTLVALREETVRPFGTLGQILTFLTQSRTIFATAPVCYRQYHETHVSLNLFHVWFIYAYCAPRRHILDHNPVYCVSPLNFVWTVVCLLPPKPNTYKFSNALSLQ